MQRNIRSHILYSSIDSAIFGKLYRDREERLLSGVNYLRFMAIRRIELIYGTNTIERRDEARHGVSRRVGRVYGNSDCMMVNRPSPGANRKIITGYIVPRTKHKASCRRANPPPPPPWAGFVVVYRWMGLIGITAHYKLRCIIIVL